MVFGAVGDGNKDRAVAIVDAREQPKQPELPTDLEKRRDATNLSSTEPSESRRWSDVHQTLLKTSGTP